MENAVCEGRFITDVHHLYDWHHLLVYLRADVRRVANYRGEYRYLRVDARSDIDEAALGLRYQSGTGNTTPQFQHNSNSPGLDSLQVPHDFASVGGAARLYSATTERACCS